MTDNAASAAGASARAMFFASASAPALLRGPTIAYAAEDGGGSGALSLDEAVALLESEPEERREAAPAAAGAERAATAAQAAPDAAAGQETGSEGETRSPDDAAGAAENQPDGSEAEADPSAVAPLEPPKYWSQDAKARFAELVPELQAVVLAQEGPREEAAAKAKAEAAQVRAQAEREIAGVSQLAEQLNVVLPQVLQEFRNRWGEAPDWVAFAQQHGADKMAVAKAKWEQDLGQVRQLQEAARQANVKAQETYVRTEMEKLKTLAPELVDSEKGVERRTEVSRYIATYGIPVAAIANISAAEITIARKAMLWDQAQAKSARPTPPPKPAASATAPLTRGGASVGTADPKTKQAQVRQQAFTKSRSIEDAVALLNALGD